MASGPGSGERWSEIEQLLDQALERAPEHRPAFLAVACGSNRALLASVERLLSAVERADAFLTDTAPAYAAPLLARMTEQPELTAGQRLAGYDVRGRLRRGGMATVYLAHDLKHDRDVALKVLSPELSAALGTERFLREIQISARLDHPHILTLINSGESDGLLWYVLPYIRGESLRDRLTREKRIAVVDALAIARQVASALAYAHRQGVIHRDIKPENILLHEGEAMLADFGIALAISDAAEEKPAQSRALFGTPHYMSPEQATGDESLDARSDVYALGAVLFEMLTGETPHTGRTAQDVIAKLLTNSPPRVRALRDTVPVGIDNAVAKALSKLPADRFGSAAEFAGALSLPVIAGDGAQPSPWRDRLRYGAMVALAVAAVAEAWMALRGRPQAVERFSLAFPRAEALQSVENGPRIALSPDGSRLVYVGPGATGTQLWLRDLDRLHAVPIPGTGGAESPFFSPDGERVGFYATFPVELKVVSLSDGRITSLADTGVTAGGGAWGPDGYLYFDTPRGIQRIKSSGGLREPVATIDTARHEAGYAWPEVLPNARGLLLRLRRTGESTHDFDIVVVDLRTRERHELLRGVFARYTASGYLVVVTADGKVEAAAFDQNKLELRGAPTTVLEGLGVHILGAVDLALSATGTLAYTPRAASGSRRPVWVNRDGLSRPVDSTWSDAFSVPEVSLSPNGKYLAVGLFHDSTGRADIWVKHLDTGPLSRLTFERMLNFRPAWTADGRSVLFLSNPGSANSAALYAQRPDGSTPAKRLLKIDRDLAEGLESRDGRWLIVRTAESTPGGGDILAMRLGVDSVPVPLLATRFAELSPTLSPNGHWLAYTSNESGRPNVYVSPFPNTNAARWQVSSAGGTEPLWAHSGRELFYRSETGEMVAAQVTTSPTFSLGHGRNLFPARSYVTDESHRAYDVSADDQRFMMIATGLGDQSNDLILVQNWFEELKAEIKQ